MLSFYDAEIQDRTKSSNTYDSAKLPEILHRERLQGNTAGKLNGFAGKDVGFAGKDVGELPVESFKFSVPVVYDRDRFFILHQIYRHNDPFAVQLTGFSMDPLKEILTIPDAKFAEITLR